MRALLTFVVLLSQLWAPSSLALEVAGVKLDDTVTVTPDGTELALNGAGIRKKFFIKVYVGALYVAEKSQSAEAIYAQPGPKRVLLHFLYKNVSAEDITDAWNEGFESNLSQAELSALQDRIDQFGAMWPSVGEGDIVLLDYLPNEGTRVTIKDEVKGTIPGDDFNTALLKIWIGDKPATKSLKQGMLGF